MSKVPIKVLLDETMAPFMPFITTSAVQLQDGEHSLEDLETAVANSIITGSYNNLNKKIILTAQNGHTVEFSIADIIYGLQSEITNQNKLSSDLVDDSNHTNKFVSASDKTTWNGKQDALVSGTNIKTINNQSILGSGNISISSGGGTNDYTNLENKPSINNVTLSGNKSSSDLSLQETLVSGTNIKTINNNSILGSGNINIDSGQTIQYSTMPTASADNVGKIVQYIGTTTASYTNGYFYICVSDGETPATYSWVNLNVQNLSSKQDTLISGTNIKTINGSSVLGSGDLVVSGGQTIQYSTMPTASADNVGQIVQYIGTSSQDYWNGFFYKCIEDNGSYKWASANINQNILSIDEDINWNGSLSVNILNLITQEQKDMLVYFARKKEPFIIIFNNSTSSKKAVALFKPQLYKNNFTSAFTTNISSSNAISEIRNSSLSLEVNDINNITSITRFKSSNSWPQFIPTTNTQAFTPTGDYNPATKKYVDDQVGAINTALSTLTTGNGV